MAGTEKSEKIKKLEEYNTPSVTNVVATYPGHPLCLSLYHPWNGNWYTDKSLHCIYPDLGPRAGYAVTCVFGLPDPDYTALSFADVADALEDSPKPSILVIEQRFPPEISGKVGLSGGNMTTAMKSLGCLGCISNGPSRDIDEIRPMQIQYLLSGVCAGHGPMAIHAVNVPVSVAGMDVSSGEIIHMDENGACKFPSDKLEQVLENLEAMANEEDERMDALAKANSSSEIRQILEGHSYGGDSREDTH